MIRMSRSPSQKPQPHSPARPVETAAPATNLPAWLRVYPNTVHLSLRVQPRSSHNRLQSELGGQLRIRLTAPPVDSKANQALVVFLAEVLHCSRSQITLVRGHSSRQKTIEIRGIRASEVLERLKPDSQLRTLP